MSSRKPSANKRHRLNSGDNTSAEITAHQLIQQQLQRLAILGAAPAVLGTGAGVVNAIQGEDADLLDNGLVNTMSDALGYGVIGAGIGAVSTPGIRRQTYRDAGLMTGRPIGTAEAKANPIGLGKRQQIKRAELGVRAKSRAMFGAGVTAAGAGLANLIGSMRNENPERIADEDSGGGLVGGVSTAALLGALGLSTVMDHDELNRYTDYSSDIDGFGGDFETPYSPVTPRPGGGGGGAQLLLEPGVTPIQGNPLAANVVDVVPADAIIMGEGRRRRTR